jgi:UDP-MurNAc hydroxylase
MKVQWFRSATVGISAQDGSTILCDPWITDGAFLGSWFHFPQLEGFEFNHLLLKKWDAVYISHLHADHFDRKFVSALARAQPNCMVIIPAFAHDWLRRAVENCGFGKERILALDSGESTIIGGITATVFVADHCDPGVCGVSVPCHNRDPRLAALDSIAVFDADGRTVVNANDALAIASTSRVLSKLSRVDLLLGHYGGAGPFPQSFIDMSDQEKNTKKSSLAKGFLSRLAGAANAVEARYVMPFAGHYVLGGRLSSLNKFRSVVTLSEALIWMKKHSAAIPVAVAPFGTFDVETGEISAAWEEPSSQETEKYLEQISAVTFAYEKAPLVWDHAASDLHEALEGVAAEYQRGLIAGQDATHHRISVQTSLVSGWIDFEGTSTTVAVRELSPMREKETRLACHPNLLKGLVKRGSNFNGFTPMHFNQAEIGSHIEWRRNGEYDEVVRCLNFMQVGSSRNLPLLPHGQAIQNL